MTLYFIMSLLYISLKFLSWLLPFESHKKFKNHLINLYMQKMSYHLLFISNNNKKKPVKLSRFLLYLCKNTSLIYMFSLWDCSVQRDFSLPSYAWSTNLRPQTLVVINILLWPLLYLHCLMPEEINSLWWGYAKWKM